MIPVEPRPCIGSAQGRGDESAGLANWAKVRRGAAAKPPGSWRPGRPGRCPLLERCSDIWSLPGARVVPDGGRHAGLRRGELQGLRWEDIDLEAGLIRVERGWDRKAGPIEPKSAKARRRVPIPSSLRRHLLAHHLAQGRPTSGLVFGSTAERPFEPRNLTRRADVAWRRAGLERITLHECRHSFASLMIAAGVNVKALSAFMGHAGISITLDLYGHLMPGAEDEAAGLLDAYLSLDGATTGAISAN